MYAWTLVKFAVTGLETARSRMNGCPVTPSASACNWCADSDWSHCFAPQAAPCCRTIWMRSTTGRSTWRTSSRKLTPRAPMASRYVHRSP